jgi:hypothetical protein
MAMIEDNNGMDDGVNETKQSTRQQLVEVFESWFEAKPSVYPPNLYDIIELKKGKQIRRDHNPVEAITKKEYEKYKAVDAKYCTVLFEFTPRGIRKNKLSEKSDYLLKRKDMKNLPWSFGSCHACWKKVRRNFSDERKTPHPYQSQIDDPNLSVLGGCGCIICNGCVMEMEKYSKDDDRWTGCPYCGHQAAFPKDLLMWCVSEQVEGHYTTEVKQNKMNEKIQEMKKDMARLGVPVRTMHLSEDGEMSYKMDTDDKL